MDLIETQLINPLEHWYYHHKFNSIYSGIESYLVNSNLIIDVGAGSALFSHEILRRHVNLHCVAIDIAYQRPLLTDELNRITYRQTFVENEGDIFLLTDVLEHVDSDVDFLRGYVANAPESSIFVITVPAFMSLWSGHDVFLKHFRRYRKKQVEQLAADCGLELVRSSYIYTVLFPIVWAIRKFPTSRKTASQLRHSDGLINTLIKKILILDGVLGKVLPFGVSILVIAQKPSINLEPQIL